MSVVVSSCGRFHSFYLAKSLQKNGLLKHYFSAGMPDDRDFFSAEKISFYSSINFADRFFIKFKLDRIFNLSAWYVARDELFDYLVSSKVFLQNPKVITAWGNSALRTFSRASNNTTKVLEIGSMHILEQEQRLKDEFEKRSIYFPKILQANKSKMLKEYEVADFIMVPSDQVKNSFLQRGFLPEKIIKIKYGCNLSFAAPITIVQNDDPVFLFVGNFSLQKGAFYLLKAWEILMSQNIKAQLHVVGNICADGKELLNHFQHLKNIHFFGGVKHQYLAWFYHKSDFFILPSVQEGLAMVIGEAMAAGLCVIASDTTGASELLEHKVSGLIFDTGSVDDLLSHIKWCLDNSESVAKIRSNAANHAQKNSWDNYEKNVVSFYKTLI